MAACPSTVSHHPRNSHLGVSTYVLHQHETLGVGDDLGGVEGLLEVVDEGLLVTLELGLGAVEEAGCADTLVLEGGKAAREDSLADEGDGHAQVESVDGGPLAGTLLAGRVENLLEERSSVVVVEVQNVAGNLDQEGVEDTLVPLRKDVTHLLVAQTKTTLHDVVGLGDELHVAVLDTVVDLAGESVAVFGRSVP